MRRIKHDEPRPSIQNGIDKTDDLNWFLYDKYKNNEPMRFYTIRQHLPAGLTLNLSPIVAYTCVFDTSVGDDNYLEKIKDELSDYATKNEKVGYLSVVSLYQFYEYEDKYYGRFTFRLIKDIRGE